MKAEARNSRVARYSTSKFVGVLCALAVVALFSGFTLVSRLGQLSGLTPFDLAALRFGISGLILLPVIFRHRAAGLNFSQAMSVAFLGGLGFAPLAYAGIFLAPASHGTVLLHGTLPLTTALIVLVIDPRQSRRRAVPGIVLIGLGISIMAWDSLRGASAGQLAGDALLLLASLSLSAYGVSIRRLAVPPLQAAAVVAVVSMLCFLPPYLALRGDVLFAVGWRELLVQGLFQGLLIGVLSIFLYTRAVANLGAVETALFTAAVPVITAVGAIPLLSEWPSLPAWVAVGIVTAGMFLAIQSAGARIRHTSFSKQSSGECSSSPQNVSAGIFSDPQPALGYTESGPVRRPTEDPLAGDRQRSPRSTGMVIRAVLSAIEWWERRRSYRILKTLSDRTLKDMGLSRSGLWEVASRAASERRLERVQKLGSRTADERTEHARAVHVETCRDCDCEPNRSWRPNFWI